MALTKQLSLTLKQRYFSRPGVYFKKTKPGRADCEQTGSLEVRKKNRNTKLTEQEEDP